jgi:OmpA-OmpF porin, OOP family
MTMKKVLPILMLLVSNAAYSNDIEPKWYVGASVGQASVSDIDISRKITLAPPSGGGTDKLKADMDRDSAYGIALGYRFNNNISTELSFSRQKNYSDTITNNIGTNLPANSLKLESENVLLNAIYTYDRFETFLPYVGVGLGGSKLRMKKQDSLGSDSDSNWAFAYQAILGAEIKILEQWRLFGQYQYLKVDNPDLTAKSIKGGVTNSWSISEYESKTFSLGARFSF